MKNSKIKIELSFIHHLTVTVFSLAVNWLWFDPAIEAVKEIKFVAWILFFVFVIFQVLLSLGLNYLFSRSIRKQVYKYRRRAVSEFMDYLDEDKYFQANVFRKDVDLFDSNHEKIGTGTVYNEMQDKYNDFVNNLEE